MQPLCLKQILNFDVYLIILFLITLDWVDNLYFSFELDIKQIVRLNSIIFSTLTLCSKYAKFWNISYYFQKYYLQGSKDV